MELAEGTGIPLLLADAYHFLGDALRLSGNWAEARNADDRAFDIVDERRIMIGPVPRIQLGLAEAAVGEGDLDRAQQLIDEVIDDSTKQKLKENDELLKRAKSELSALPAKGMVYAGTVHKAGPGVPVSPN